MKAILFATKTDKNTINILNCHISNLIYTLALETKYLHLEKLNSLLVT